MNEPKKSEIETIETEGLIWVLPKDAKHKPIKISSIENILEELTKAGVIEMAEPLKPDWTTEDEERRRELVWRDFVAEYSKGVFGSTNPVAEVRHNLISAYSKNDFLDAPISYTEERMNALVQWAEDKKKEVVGFVERTMKAYGPEDEK